MTKSEILAFLGPCILMLVYVAAADTASVIVDTDRDCNADIQQNEITIQNGWTALDLLGSVCEIAYTNESWGAFVTTINGMYLDYDNHADWWMFTINNSSSCPSMSGVGLSNYVVQNGDTIGMWNVTGNLMQWPCNCTE
jgi:hypothetical protein